MILRFGGDVSDDRQMRQKPADFARSHLLRMPHPVKGDIFFNPVNINLLGLQTVMPRPHRLAHLIQKLRHKSAVQKRRLNKLNGCRLNKLNGLEEVSNTGLKFKFFLQKRIISL
jgi:hypothetical protein